MNFIADRTLVNELNFYFSSGSHCVNVKCCEHPSLIKSLICSVVLSISDVNKNWPTYMIVKKDNFLVFDFYPKCILMYKIIVFPYIWHNPSNCIYFSLLCQLLDSSDAVLAEHQFYTRSRISVCPTMLCAKYLTENVSGWSLLFTEQIQHSLIFQPGAGGTPWRIREMLVFCSMPTALQRCLPDQKLLLQVTELIE